MAIQFRRGQHNKFDKTKMLAGEPAVVLGGDPDTADGKALYIAFAQGDATRMARADEIPGEASQSAAGLMSAGDKAKLDGVAVGANAYVHPSYTARTGKPTGNQTPAFGATFPVSQIVTDAQGHVTAATDRTVRIPDTEASQGAHGLMSAADKKALDAIKVTSGNKLHRLVTAPVVTASDAYAAPPVALCVQGKSVQDGTPAPDAPVAIQSVESVGLGAAGKNLLDTAACTPKRFINRATGAIGTSDGWSATDYIPVVAGQTYTLSGIVNTWSGSAGGAFYDAGKVFVSGMNYNAYTFTVPDDACYVRISLSTETPSGIQLELGASATAYTPFVTSSTTPIPLDGHALRSLPDGTHDELRVDADGNVTLVQRVGTVTYGSDATESDVWSVGPTYNGRIVVITPSARPITSSDEPSACAMSTLFPTKTHRQTNAGEVGCSLWPNITVMAQTRVAIITGDTSIDTKAKAVAWLAANPVTIDYPLAEPVEIPLGTVALPSMPAPDLTAWASCTPATEIELDYERDVSLVIAQLEAQIAEIATA